MIDELVASASLPCARCGYPVVDSALRWNPRIHCSGPLAELELGPVARNIVGARRAGDRLVGAAQQPSVRSSYKRSQTRTLMSLRAEMEEGANRRRKLTDSTVPPPDRGARQAVESASGSASIESEPISSRELPT